MSAKKFDLLAATRVVDSGRRSDATRLPDHVSIVIAAYNEASRIGGVLDGILETLASATIPVDLVVVDDGSTDNTAETVLRRAVWYLKHPVNLGQGASLQTGIDFALSRGATQVVTFDADGQHRPEDILVLLNALHEHRAEFALGSRFLGTAEGIPRVRRLLLWGARLFTRLISGVHLTDVHNGLRAMTRQGAQHIRLHCNRMEHASEIIDQIVRSGLKYVETPVRIVYSADSLQKGQKSSAAVGLAVRLLLEKVTR